MAQKGKISLDSKEELKQIEKELEEELRYAVASAKGIVSESSNNSAGYISRPKICPSLVLDQTHVKRLA